MADISSYPMITPTSSDLVLIVDRSQDGNPTRTASVQSVANLANAIQLGYTSLVQLLTKAANKKIKGNLKFFIQKFNGVS